MGWINRGGVALSALAGVLAEFRGDVGVILLLRCALAGVVAALAYLSVFSVGYRASVRKVHLWLLRRPLPYGIAVVAFVLVAGALAENLSSLGAVFVGVVVGVALTVSIGVHPYR